MNTISNDYRDNDKTHVLNRVTVFIPRPVWAIPNGEFGLIMEDYSNYFVEIQSFDLVDAQSIAA